MIHLVTLSGLICRALYAVLAFGPMSSALFDERCFVQRYQRTEQRCSRTHASFPSEHPERTSPFPSPVLSAPQVQRPPLARLVTEHEDYRWPVRRTPLTASGRPWTLLLARKSMVSQDFIAFIDGDGCLCHFMLPQKVYISFNCLDLVIVVNKLVSHE